MAMSGQRASISPTAQDILYALSDAEKLFWASLALTSRKGAMSNAREATTSLSMVQALQSALGKSISDGTLPAIFLLGWSSFVII